MRVVHVCESLASGTLGVVAAIATRHAAAGHEVTIAYGRRPETPLGLREAVGPGVELVALGWARRTPAANVAAAARLRRVVQVRRPDVVHLHSSFAGLVGASAIPRSVPLVYTPHGSPVQRDDGTLARLIYRHVEGAVCRRATIVGAVSWAEAKALERLRPRCLEVVPNGIVELDCPPEVPQRPGPPVVACLGRMTDARRPRASIRILGMLRDVARVQWIGGGAPEDEAAARAAGVEVTGWLSQAAAMAELSGASVLLHWSAWDGLPLVVLEALARDVAVIASDIPANREVLPAGQVHASEASAEQAIRRLLVDPAARQATLEEQRPARGAYGADRMSRDWIKVYSRAAASTGPTGAAQRSAGAVPA